MGSPAAWRGLWRAFSRCGRSPYTTPAPPRLNLAKEAEVADGSGRRHLAVQRHAISTMLATRDLMPSTSTSTEEWWKRRRRYHGPSWVQPHAPSRFFSATPKDLLQRLKADPSDLVVANPGDGGDGPGDMSMYNQFASARPLALVAQGRANVSGDSPLDYPLVKAEDNGLTEAIKCYILKAGADQIDPEMLSLFLKWAAEYGTREDVEIVFPLSSPISTVANWSGDGIISHVKMKIKQLEVICWLLYLRVQSRKIIGHLHMNTSNCHEWWVKFQRVQEHVGATFKQKLVDPADEATKYCTENRMTRLIPKIIKIGFAAIYLIYSADPEEVKCWQIRYLTKAPQAAGEIHFDFERGFICVELPPHLGFLVDPFTCINEPDSIYGITRIKEVYAYLDPTLICRRKMLPQMSSSCYVLPQLQMGRLFSQRKRKSVNEIILKAKNSSILDLDGSRDEVLSSLREVIAQLRQFCYDYGQRVDVSSIYGPGKEVYTPAGIGTFHLRVLHNQKSIDFPISASNLYFGAFRCEDGMFVFQQVSDFICDEDYTVLNFTGSSTAAGLEGHNVGDTWLGVEALRHAFHVISKHKSKGRSSDLLKQALKIFIIHISEAARIQSVLNAVCLSMTDAGRTFLDPEASPADSPPTPAPSRETDASPATSLSSSQTEAGPSISPATFPPSSATEAAPVASPPTPPPSYWIGTYGHYSEQAKKAIDKQLTRNQKHIIISKGAYKITSLDDILKQIRILSRDVHKVGVFAHEADDSPLALPKECLPDAIGKEVEYPYVLLEEWDTGKFV